MKINGGGCQQEDQKEKPESASLTFGLFRRTSSTRLRKLIIEAQPEPRELVGLQSTN